MLYWAAMTKEPLSFFDDQPPRPRRAADPDGPAEAVTGDPAPGTGAKHAADAPTGATPLWVAGAKAAVAAARESAARVAAA